MAGMRRRKLLAMHMCRTINNVTGFFAVITCIAACIDNNKWLPKSPQETVVLIQPLAQVDTGLLQTLKDSIPKYYPVSVTLAAPVNMPAGAYYKPRNRYKADSILGYLHKIKPADCRIIAGITVKDISTRKGGIEDYGVMGLGLQPGDACVTSLYRLYKDNPSEQLFARRLLKTVVHELGHNFGLPHCPDKHCIMADAEGKLSQDNEAGLCSKCRKRLNLP